MVYKKPSVLIVDDEKVVCDLLYDELSERGYLCTTALDGNDALTKLAAQDFDVVLLDIRLPGMSGMKVLSEIRSNHHKTPAIMITCVSDIDTAVQAMKLGASDYIVKPFQLDRIDTSIGKLLQAKQRLPKRRDYKTPLYLGGEAEDKQAVEESFSEMNAIACGVEVKYELLTGYSSIVSQRTIEIAWQLGISEKAIQRWADMRVRLESERNRTITSLLNKLERSPLAQKILGITMPHHYTPKLDESQN